GRVRAPVLGGQPRRTRPTHPIREQAPFERAIVLGGARTRPDIAQVLFEEGAGAVLHAPIGFGAGLSATVVEHTAEVGQTTYPVLGPPSLMSEQIAHVTPGVQGLHAGLHGRTRDAALPVHPPELLGRSR